MKSIVVRFIAILILLVVSVFGFFLYKSHGDFKLAKSMMVFETNKLISKTNDNVADGADWFQSEVASQKESEAYVAGKAADEASENPNSIPNKDTIYKGKGNAFSDIKIHGGETVVELKETNK